MPARVCPRPTLHLGDLQTLPYDDDTFDVVTGFTSFFFADDIVAALREAGRVARPGAPVVIQVFGRPERCDLEAMKEAVAAFRPRAGGRAGAAYWRPGIVEELRARRPGSRSSARSTSTWAYTYADDQALALRDARRRRRGAVAGPEREPELRAAILRALAHCRQPDGSYRVSNEWHVVIARA